jgi:hypothetical protein
MLKRPLPRTEQGLMDNGKDRSDHQKGCSRSNTMQGAGGNQKLER